MSERDRLVAGIRGPTQPPETISVHYPLVPARSKRQAFAIQILIHHSPTMPEIEAPIPASPNFEKLKDKLRELFELNKAISTSASTASSANATLRLQSFLDRHLEKPSAMPLQRHQTVIVANIVQLKHDLEKAEAAQQERAFLAEQSPRVMELREKLAKGAGDLEAIADEVYSRISSPSSPATTRAATFSACIAPPFTGARNT